MLQSRPDLAGSVDEPLRIGILTNRASTRNRRPDPRFARAMAAGEAHIHVTVDGVDGIPGALRRLAQARPAVLAINGGDGTVQAVLTQLASADPFPVRPPIAVLPGGKTNMIARDLGARGGRAQLFGRLSAQLAAGALADRLVERSLVAMHWGDQRQFGLFFGGAGVVRGMLWCRRAVYRWPLPAGLANCAALGLVIGSAFAGSRFSLMASPPLTLRPAGGPAHSGCYAVILATTLDGLLFGLRPFADETEATGFKLSAVRQGAGPVLQAARALAARRFDRLPADAGLARTVRSLVLSDPGVVTLDGELFEPAGEVQLACGPAVRFLSFS